ncbi:MAG: hypothetical protein H7263_00190 [Candidatus Sericytochromatia bacterium]|nr:hypothetical protein [Candidatus Sericytochromatia bacterium]
MNLQLSNSKPTNRRGKQTHLDGKNFEKYFTTKYSMIKPEEMNLTEKNFFKKLLIDKGIKLAETAYIHIQDCRGNGKTDVSISILQKNYDTKKLIENIQIKSVPENTQFLIGSVNKFADIIRDKYPHAATAFEKVVGYGQWAPEAKKNGYGGLIYKKINGIKTLVKADYRYLCSELSVIERCEIKGLSEDKEYWMKLVKYITQGDGINKPSYCIFPIQARSTNPDDWRIFKYEDLFETIESIFDDGRGHQNCSMPTSKHVEKYSIGIKIGAFNIKIKDAGKDDSDGHQLQVMASPTELYEMIEKRKKALTYKVKN